MDAEVLDSTFYQIIHSLKVISTIRENDRISTKKGIFVDPSDNPMQPVARWLHSENRFHNLNTLQNIFDRSFQVCEQLLQLLPSDQLRRNQQIARLQQELRNAQRGLSNLMVTYETDSHTVAKLVLLNERIQDHLQQIDQLWQN